MTDDTSRRPVAWPETDAPMKSVFTGELLVLMPENASEAAALARWRDGHAGQFLELLSNAGPGATLRFIEPLGADEGAAHDAETKITQRTTEKVD